MAARRPAARPAPVRPAPVRPAEADIGVGARHYVAILQGKAAEYGALRDLADRPAGRTTPLVNVPPPDFDYQHQRFKRPFEAHVALSVERLTAAWSGRGPLWLDAGALERLLPPPTVRGAHVLRALCDDAAAAGVSVVPVTAFDRYPPHYVAAREVVRSHRTGLCIRLAESWLLDTAAYASLLTRALTYYGVAPEEVDLVLDRRAIPLRSTEATVAASWVELLRAVPLADRWRSLTAAAGAFPVSLSAVRELKMKPTQASATGALRRAEWLGWRALAAGLASADGAIPRMPSFGDYAVSHPLPLDIDPRVLNPAASVRYTTADALVVIRGRPIRKLGNGQHRRMAQELVARVDFAGAPFSAGDRYAVEVASGREGPGTPTTWRRAGTVHHLTHVAEHLATLSGP